MLEKNQMDFSGGLNTVTAQDSLKDNELRDLVNVDLDERGSLKKRHGMVKYLEAPVSGFGQGYFRYFHDDGTFQNIQAINGKLYKDGAQLPITGLPSFQTDRMIEAVQFKDKLFIATGTKLVEYNGTTAKVVEPYKPKPLEVYEIGTNGLADNPDEYMQDGEGAFLRIEGVTSDLKKGVVNRSTTFKVYVSKPVGSTNYFKCLYRKEESDEWSLLKDWSTSNVFQFTPRSLGGYQLDFRAVGSEQLAEAKKYDQLESKLKTIEEIYKKIERIREKIKDLDESDEDFTTKKEELETELEAEKEKYDNLEDEIETMQEEDISDNSARYIIPAYEVHAIDKNEDKDIDVKTIHTCNRILLHWNRLVMYGDTKQNDQVFISHLNEPTYFPVPHTLKFNDETKKGLVKLVRYRSVIVAFTESTIQALYGTSPSDFRRFVVNTHVGCIAPESAVTMANDVAFLSREGVYVLKSLGYNEEIMNVEKIDGNIDNIMHQDEDACGISLDGQYHILFPGKEKRFRFYYELGGRWTKDESPKLKFSRFYSFDGELYGQIKETGEVMKFDRSVWNDDGHVYRDLIELKQYDFGLPYNEKKVKQIELLMSHHISDINLSVYAFADAQPTVRPEKTTVYIDENNDVQHKTEYLTNVNLDAGTILGYWELGHSAWGNQESSVKKIRLHEGKGRCRKMKLLIAHEEDTPNHLLGVGFMYVPRNR